MKNSTQTAKLALIRSTGDQNEIRTSLKRFKGLGQRGNLIKMEIRPGKVQLCFCHWHSAPLNSSLLGHWERRRCDLFVDGKTFSPQNDRLHLFLCNYSFKTLLIIYMKKEQSTSVTVAHSNHFSYIASFSHHISILVCFILPHSVFSTQSYSLHF